MAKVAQACFVKRSATPFLSLFHQIVQCSYLAVPANVSLANMCVLKRGCKISTFKLFASLHVSHVTMLQQTAIEGYRFHPQVVGTEIKAEV